MPMYHGLASIENEDTGTKPTWRRAPCSRKAVCAASCSSRAASASCTLCLSISAAVRNVPSNPRLWFFTSSNSRLSRSNSGSPCHKLQQRSCTTKAAFTSKHVQQTILAYIEQAEASFAGVKPGAVEPFDLEYNKEALIAL